MRETYLYPYSAEEACRRGEQSLWRASYLENIDCKDAIQKAVRQHYDGAHLDKECLTGVLQEFGYKRTAWVLANTVQQLEWGGQYSSENKAWASQIYIPPDKLHNLSFVVPTRSAVLDGVVDQYRTAYWALGLFGPDQCESGGRRDDPLEPNGLYRCAEGRIPSGVGKGKADGAERTGTEQRLPRDGWDNHGMR